VLSGISTSLTCFFSPEEDGISEFILRKVHHLASLPQSGRISSLNVSVAAGVAMFEIVRQRFNLAKG
jgi:23S rRNA (guanosine2251-2'-O)-methyltransferase